MGFGELFYRLLGCFLGCFAIPFVIAGALRQPLSTVGLRSPVNTVNGWWEVADIHEVQELMGHKDVKTTEIYTHVMDKDVDAVKSPLDMLSGDK